jgi:uncharacterized protein
VNEESALRPFLLKVVEQYRLSLDGIHGIPHWARVLENGRRLASITGADLAVVELFAIFHDACRQSDGRDPDHGPRAADLVRSLRAAIPLDDGRIAHLVEACACHTRGPRHGAAMTVLACLDADRLDIPRVGKWIRPELLCTAAARNPRLIAWASGRASRRVVPALCVGEWGWAGVRS